MSERNSSADPHEAGRVKPVGGHDHAVLRHTLRVLLGIALFLYFVVVLAVLGLRYIVLPHAENQPRRIRTQIDGGVGGTSADIPVCTIRSKDPMPVL